MTSLTEYMIHIATVVTAFSTLFVGIATVYMARATRRIADITELTLKAGTTPQVIVYLQDHFYDYPISIVHIVLENIGQGTAQNVTCRMIFEDKVGKELAEKYFIASKTDLKMDFMPQGTKREMMLGTLDDLYDENTNMAKIAPFSVIIQYENLEGRQHTEKSFTLDVRNFDYSGSSPDSLMVTIDKSLQSLPKIEQHLRRLIGNRVARTR